jgi:hypothetical protein
MASPLVVPKPYAGCDVCRGLLRSWVVITEPASPHYSRSAADLIAEEINSHREQDMLKAPAL